MPPASIVQAEKDEREGRLLEALKLHILKERQRKKEEHEAEVEEERQRKEREARERQDVMTLGETREQILKLDQTLKELRNRKQQLFLQLKKVLNEDENRKKQQQQKDSELFTMHALPPQANPHGQIFLPPRQTHQQLLQKGSPISLGNQPMKRGRSPSPPIPQSYYKTSAYSSQKHDDNRRGNDVARVLWNKPTQYQNPPGTLFYQTTAAPQNQPDSRSQSIIYPSYNPNLSIPLRQNYHLEIPQVPPSQTHSQKVDATSKTAQIYHINLDQPPTISQTNQSNQSLSHKPQITMEKLSDRSGYHVEVKLDPSQQPTHLPENVVYTSLIPGMPMHPNVMQMPTNQPQNSKATGSITQGYSSRGSTQSQLPGQQTHPQPIHYQRRLF